MPSSFTVPSTFTTMPFCSCAAVFGVSSIEMLAVVSSKRTPLTIVLPLVMTPVETVLAPPPATPVPPVPPVSPPPPPPAATRQAAHAAGREGRRHSRGDLKGGDGPDGRRNRS